MLRYGKTSHLAAMHNLDSIVIGSVVLGQYWSVLYGQMDERTAGMSIPRTLHRCYHIVMLLQNN